MAGKSEQAQSGHIAQLLADAREAARLRSLATYGKVGEIVDYSGNFHEKSDKSMPLEAKVRIVVPAVVRQSGDRIVGVLLKALVVEA